MISRILITKDQQFFPDPATTENNKKFIKLAEKANQQSNKTIHPIDIRIVKSETPPPSSQVSYSQKKITSAALNAIIKKNKENGENGKFEINRQAIHHLSSFHLKYTYMNRYTTRKWSHASVDTHPSPSLSANAISRETEKKIIKIRSELEKTKNELNKLKKEMEKLKIRVGRRKKVRQNIALSQVRSKKIVANNSKAPAEQFARWSSRCEEDKAKVKPNKQYEQTTHRDESVSSEFSNDLPIEEDFQKVNNTVIQDGKATQDSDSELPQNVKATLVKNEEIDDDEIRPDYSAVYKDFFPLI